MGLAVLGVWAVTACGGSDRQGQIRQSALVAPTVVEGNPRCPEGYSEFKIDPPHAGEYAAGDGFEVEIGYTDGYLWFDANQGVDIVIVKGGPNANWYAYDPEVSEDSGLITPTNPNNDKPYGYSHVSFCYDEDAYVPLEITKTAEATRRDGWIWDIEKDAACPVLTPRDYPSQRLGEYRVTLTAIAGESSWLTEGTISIYNPNAVEATIEDVEDLLDGAEVDVDCGVTFPYELAGYATLECTYSAVTATLPDENTATVTTRGDIDGDTVTVPVADGGVSAVLDDCVTVYDQFESRDPVTLGTFCVDDLVDGAVSHDYETLIQWPACGEFEFTNTAWFVTDDSQTEGSDSFTTLVEVECREPCPTEPTLNALCVAEREAELLMIPSCKFAD